MRRRGGRPLQWKVNRARAMSAREVAWRIGMAATLPLRRAATRSTGRPGWNRPEWRTAALELVRSDAATLQEAAERIAGGELRLWGQRVDVDLRRTDWSTSPLRELAGGSSDPKPLWELHRQQHVVPLAGAAGLTDREDLARATVDHLLDWVDRNPPERGPGWSSAYETAHRLVGWSIAVPLVLPWTTAAEHERLAQSFGHQCAFAWLRPSRYSSANNHRLAELTGLLAAAGCGSDRLDWERLWSELEGETERQLYADGGSREQATGYFLYVLEILATAAFFASAAGRPPGRLREQVEAMLEWLDSVAGSDGEPPPVGDDAEDRMLRLDYFGDRHAPEIARRARAILRLPARRPVPRGSTLLRSSGYAILRARDVRVVFDVGELGLGSLAAHGHADALAVLLDAGDEPILRDAGTGTYVPGRVREWLRGTAAHNTVLVGGRNQAVSLGPHLWGRRFDVTLEAADLNDAADYVRATHNGYPGVVHARSVVFVKPDLLVVLDRVEADRPVDATLAWHVREDAAVAVAASPAATAAQGVGLWSPRYGVVSERPRLTWVATGARVLFASAVSAAGRLPTLQLGADGPETAVEIADRRRVRIVECWSGPVAKVDVQYP